MKYLLLILIHFNCHAESLEQAIAVASAESGVSAELLTAIATVESNMGQRLLNARTMDFGPFQINYRTAYAMGWDLTRLYTDNLYAARSAAKLLKSLRTQYGTKEPATWFCRYNAGTGHSDLFWDYCMRYVAKVRAVDTVNIAENP